ncbi:MAG: hypothetical protein MK195_09070 [Acidimicrobiales bacterium]|nr:hypothetical protein [Acidimicrobiales bacterium]
MPKDRALMHLPKDLNQIFTPNFGVISPSAFISIGLHYQPMLTPSMPMPNFSAGP